MKDNYSDKFESAYKLHLAGNLNDAKVIYEELLKIKPDDLNLKNMYAQLNFSLKNFDVSLKYFSELYEKTKLDDVLVNISKIYLINGEYNNALAKLSEVKNKTPEVYRYIANCRISLNDFKGAIEAYINVLNANEATVSDKFNLSLAYFNVDDLDNSLKIALDIYNENPKDVNILFHLFSIYSKKEDSENQIKYLTEAAQISPSIELYCNLGILLRKAGDNEKALGYFNAIINVDPNHKQALLNIARIYQDIDKNISIQIYEELAEKYPEDSTILSQLYIMYNEIFNHESAYKIASKLIQLAPNEAYPYSFAGESLYHLGKYEESIEMFRKSSEYNVDSEYDDGMIAKMLSVLNRSDEAIDILKTKYPDLIGKSEIYTFIQLRERNIEEVRDGLYQHLTDYFTEEEIERRASRFFYKLNIDKKYGVDEAQFKTFKNGSVLSFRPKIKKYLKKDMFGKDFHNKRLLIYNANGIGDAIMFSRYLFVLKQYTDKIKLQVQNSLLSLMKFNFPEFEIFPYDYEVDENDYDYSGSFFCLLPSIKETDLKNIPYSAPYLSVDANLVSEKAKYDFMQTDKKKIGIFWMGNPVVLPQRSIQLEKLRPLFDINESQIYSFQISNVDFASDDIKNDLPLVDLAPYIKDFSDTAAFLKNIDVLVTIDTSIANLAGAMGIKTFLLMPFESEWRWFHDTDKTPWYDSVRIFRQKVPYEWDEVVERVKNELTI